MKGCLPLWPYFSSPSPLLTLAWSHSLVFFKHSNMCFQLNSCYLALLSTWNAPRYFQIFFLHICQLSAQMSPPQRDFLWPMQNISPAHLENNNVLILLLRTIKNNILFLIFLRTRRILSLLSFNNKNNKSKQRVAHRRNKKECINKLLNFK